MFDWEFSDKDMGPVGIYSAFKPASGLGGGAFTIPNESKGWLSYVGAQDIKEFSERRVRLEPTSLSTTQNSERRIDDDDGRSNGMHDYYVPA